MPVGKRRSIHPALFSDELMGPMEQMLRPYVVPHGILLDCYAGRGEKLAALAARLGMTPLGFEIEPGYFKAHATHPCVMQGDSRKDLRQLGRGSVAAGCTSPVYPNGCADYWTSSPSDGSRQAGSMQRNTYGHRLREWMGEDYQLQPGNSAAVSPRRSKKAMEEFYDLQWTVFGEMFWVLADGAVFLVNGKDPNYEPYLERTWQQLLDHGFDIIEHRYVHTRSNKEGANRDARATGEDLTLARKGTGTCYIDLPAKERTHA